MRPLKAYYEAGYSAHEISLKGEVQTNLPFSYSDPCGRVNVVKRSFEVLEGGGKSTDMGVYTNRVSLQKLDQERQATQARIRCGQDVPSLRWTLSR